MSRLTQADYHTDGNRSTHYDTRYTYDSMGNILTLKRRGMMEKADTTAHTSAAYALIDDLTFAYDGNQIIKVTDAVDDGPYYQGAWHYRDNADKQQERFYDGNGNLTKDLDAKISDIQYNSLNLPIMITFTDGSTTRYTYDATGRKLRTEHRVMTTGVFNPGQELLDDAGVLDEPGVEMPVPDFPGLNGPAAVMMPQEMEQAALPEISHAEEASGSPKRPRSTGDAPAEYLPYELTVTDYCGNFIYENGKLSRILFDGGYITFPDTTVNGVTIANINKPQYHFYFTDHLGNVRVVTDAQGNIEQINNYYPYGGLMASSSSIATPSSSYPANQPYRYNGKELDRKNNLDWMDYGARHFAGHGQWTSPDPLAEKYYDWSPYVYCIGNPIKFVDPDGRKIVLTGSRKERMTMLRYLQRLTNDNLFVNRKTGEVTIGGKRWDNRNKKLNVGTALLRDIVNNKHTMYVKVISNGEGNSERDVKPNDALNGIGTDVLVKFDVSSNIKIPTLDDKSQRVVDKERPHEIGLGHELVHGIRSMEGKAVDYKIKADYQYFNSKGQKIKVRESLEELETVGLRGTYRYSENKLRIEQKLGKRGAY